MRKTISAEDWADELKTGGHPQADGVMASHEGDRTAFCCLGVLCDMVIPEQRWGNHNWFSDVNGLETSNLPYEVTDAIDFEMEEGSIEMFAEMNDAGVPFDNIAETIFEWIGSDYDNDYLWEMARKAIRELQEA